MAQHRIQRGRPGVLRIGAAALPRLAGTMPWVPLLAGCVVGLAVSVTGRIFAAPSHPNIAAGLFICRAGFALVVAGQAFLLADPHRPVAASMPAPAWLTTAIRVLLATPVVAVTAAVQLGLAAAALPEVLPWASLAAELAGWSAVALAFAAALQRTRWHDAAGVLTVALALAGVAVLGQLPWPWFPAAIGSHAASAAWARAGWLWLGACAAGLAVAAWSSRDSWERASRYLTRFRRYPADGMTVGEAA